MDCEVDDGDEVLVVGDVDYWSDGGMLSLHPTHARVLGEGQRLLEEGPRLVDELRAELEAGDGSVEERN
jgi:exodeoxyribonuclease VII large subunit